MLACAFLCFVPAYSAYAFELPDTSKPASLTMVLKSSDDGGKVAAGAEITCYLVAEPKTSNGIVSYELTDGYDKCGLDLDNKISQSQIDDLMDHTLENKLTGISAKSDKDGKVVFSSMKQGVYLIAASDLPEGFTSFVPFLYYLPYYDNDIASWVYDGTAEPKISYYPPRDISVQKVWNDDGKDRPSSVSVALSNEDGVFDTVVLNDGNGWKYVWNDLDANKKWSVEETDVPKGYKATYSSQDGYAFTVTNTASLIQTGQPDWPVPVLLFAGSFLLCAGIIVRVAGRKSDEEQP